MHETGEGGQSQTERSLEEVDALLARNEQLADQIKKVIDRNLAALESRPKLATSPRRLSSASAGDSGHRISGL